jgi:hypothetical protein
MIITTSIPALVLAMVTSGAIPAGQVNVDRYAGPAIGTVAHAEVLRTDTPWLDGDTLLAVHPVPGYLESEEYQRWKSERLAVAPVPGYLESDEWKRFQDKQQSSGAGQQKDATA